MNNQEEGDSQRGESPSSCPWKRLKTGTVPHFFGKTARKVNLLIKMMVKICEF